MFKIMILNNFVKFKRVMHSLLSKVNFACISYHINNENEKVDRDALLCRFILEKEFVEKRYISFDN